MKDVIREWPAFADKVRPAEILADTPPPFDLKALNLPGHISGSHPMVAHLKKQHVTQQGTGYKPFGPTYFRIHDHRSFL